MVITLGPCRYSNNNKYCEYSIYTYESVLSQEQLALFPVLAVTTGSFYLQ